MLRGRTGPNLTLSALGILAVCCSEPPPSAGPSPQVEFRLDRSATLAALEYWQGAAGITFYVDSVDQFPRLLIRSGSDIPDDRGGGRGGIDGTYPEDNRARSGLVVFETGGGQYCRRSAEWCRLLYRHEIGHALGFLDHSNEGLMFETPDSLVERERAMITALYALPHGARVEADGTWRVAGTGQTGALSDLQAARDIIDWNMNASAGSSYRVKGIITRWELPVRVVMRDRP